LKRWKVKTTITYDPKTERYITKSSSVEFLAIFYRSEIELLNRILETIKILKREGTEKELIFELKEITK